MTYKMIHILDNRRADRCKTRKVEASNPKNVWDSSMCILNLSLVKEISFKAQT